MPIREARANLKRSAFTLVSTKTDKRTGVITAIVRSNINFMGSDIHIVKGAFQEAYPGASVVVRKTRANRSKREFNLGGLLPSSSSRTTTIDSVTLEAIITPAGTDSRKVKQVARSGSSRRRRKALFGIKISRHRSKK